MSYLFVRASLIAYVSELSLDISEPKSERLTWFGLPRWRFIHIGMCMIKYSMFLIFIYESLERTNSRGQCMCYAEFIA